MRYMILSNIIIISSALHENGFFKESTKMQSSLSSPRLTQIRLHLNRFHSRQTFYIMNPLLKNPATKKSLYGF